MRIAPSANSLLAALRQSSLNSRSARTKATSSLRAAYFVNSSAKRRKDWRSESLARLAALRQIKRSISRLVSRSLSCLLTFISDTRSPRCGITRMRCSRAKRWIASLMGVRPIPVISLSACSERDVPGRMRKVTMASSII